MGNNLLAGLASALQGRQQPNSLNTAKPSVAGSVLSNMMGNRETNTWGQPDLGMGALAKLLQPKNANAFEWGNASPSINGGEKDGLRYLQAQDDAKKYLPYLNSERSRRGLSRLEEQDFVNYVLSGGDWNKLRAQE
jgi:hypothetical protein